jgi:hypothetical protein
MLVFSVVSHYLRISLALILTYCQLPLVVYRMYSTDTVLHRDVPYYPDRIKNLPLHKVSYNNCKSE